MIINNMHCIRISTITYTINLRISARVLISNLGEDGGAYSRGHLFEGDHLLNLFQIMA